MIRIYMRMGCSSSYNTIAWFENYKIETKIININDISTEDLITALSYSSNGTRDLVRRRNKVSSKLRTKIKLLNEMSFNEGLYYIKNNTEILRTPIVLDKQKMLVGYNSDELGMFLSPKYRKCLIP
ncbi:ArsC/Spx/MgsR family protein [Lactococcus petauri]|uniref:ArsC/Spx/MgsR family protein n=1 Tax=Lactococcus petauri TaxID=1940789 RepID=UPI0013FE2D47|nr:ArsC/Spx/MgsR family protein [Lactococcus petauri]NHI78110.1 arsenate reductase [Lactococcus petauri]